MTLNRIEQRVVITRHVTHIVISVGRRPVRKSQPRRNEPTQHGRQVKIVEQRKARVGKRLASDEQRFEIVLLYGSIR